MTTNKVIARMGALNNQHQADKQIAAELNFREIFNSGVT
jgi:hypothetical protein